MAWCKPHHGFDRSIGQCSRSLVSPCSRGTRSYVFIIQWQALAAIKHFACYRFITTGKHTLPQMDLAINDPEDYAPIDFMIDHDVGVTTTQTYVLKRIDNDYFEE